jgi:serine/threonine-protein kinase PknG
VSAAFGLSRCHLGADDRAAAVAVLDEVPDRSAYHVAAQVAAARARFSPGPGMPGETDLLDASARVRRLKLDPQRRARLSIELLERALAWVLVRQDHEPDTPAPDGLAVLGRSLTERELRFGMEESYRLLATMEHDPFARYALVDTANAVRPRTVV